MTVDGGNLLVTAIGLVISVAFTLWFVRRQTNATVDQAGSAKRQVEIAEQVRKESSEPYVVVDIRPSSHISHIFVLVIENTGPTVARDVKITFDPPIERLEEQESGWAPLRDSALLKEGISAMPPGRRMEWFFDVTFKRLNSNLPTVYTATVDAEGPGGKVETLTYKIDLTMYTGLQTIGIKNIHDGVKAIANVADAAEQIASSLERAVKALPGDK